jgi:hypothetical protein
MTTMTRLTRVTLSTIMLGSAIIGAGLATPAPALAMTAEPTPIRLVGDRSAATTSTDRVFEEATAACMAAHGFEYIPNVATITFTPLVGHDDVTLVEIDAGADPNEAIVDGLTVAQRIAYHRAYWGPDTRLDAEGYMVSDPANTIADDACVLG